MRNAIDFLSRLIQKYCNYQVDEFCFLKLGVQKEGSRYSLEESSKKVRLISNYYLNKGFNQYTQKFCKKSSAKKVLKQNQIKKI
jgi:hypothetical protein